MWEPYTHTSHRGNPLRRIFTFAVSAIVAAFLYILIINPAVNAADTATWSGDDIVYDDTTYVPTKASSANLTSLKAGTVFYQHLNLSDGGKAYSISFPSGNVNSASSASYAIYNLDNSKYGKLVTSKDIAITPKNKSTATTDAYWKDGNIIYKNVTYVGDSSGKPFVSTGSNPPLVNGAQYYQHLDLGSNKAYYIYFGSSTSPPDEKTAGYQTFDIGANSTFVNPGKVQVISITPVNGTSSTGASTTDADATSCDVDGIGWIVCPVSNFLAKGMDNIFDLLKGFLIVQPLATDTSNSLYKTWNYVRSIANIAFVIAFLIIIYSQITNVGITNYAIKKLLPRLIIAAVLVNISYFICAIAVDASNIIGDSLQKVLISIRAATGGPNTNDVSSWESITGYILSGSTAATAAGVGIATTVIATGGSGAAAVILLIPILVGLLLAVLVALIVLAARQALIIILIIVSPLAFVAYLLPNTEKWFERWRKLLLDMLMFFPIFSLIFGGSQLAGFLIIQNANQINVILLGMFVQVAPLVLTPLLIRFSGDVVGKIAGMVNNPKKGLLDRTRNWAQDRSQALAANNLGRTDPVRNRQVFRRYALGADMRRRTREGRKAMSNVRSDARWANSEQFAAIDQQQRFAQDQKGLGESLSEQRYAESKTVVGAVRNLDVNINNAKLDVENAKTRADLDYQSNQDPTIVERRLQQRVTADSLAAVKSTEDAKFEEFRAGSSAAFPATAAAARMFSQSQIDTRLLALNGIRSSLAKQIQVETRTTQLLDNTERIDGRLIRSYTGGINSKGADRALALALTEQHKAHVESIANADAIIERMNLDANDTLQVAKNISVKGIVVSSDIQEAAVKKVAAGGVMTSIFELLEGSNKLNLTPSGNEELRIAMVEALRGNTGRPKFLGFGILDQLTQGIARGVDQPTVDDWIKSMILDGKLSANELATQDKDTIVRISQGIARLPKTPAFSVALGGLRQEIINLKANGQLWDKAGERKSAINDIEHLTSR